MTKQRKTKFGDLWTRLCKWAYQYRGWWFDSTSVIVLYLFIHDVKTGGIHPVDSNLIKFFAAALWLFVTAKQRVRVETKGKLTHQRSIRGEIMMAIWLGSLLYCYLLQSFHPDLYPLISPYFVVTTFNVLLAFTGGVILKKRFLKKFPEFKKILDFTNVD